MIPKNTGGLPIRPDPRDDKFSEIVFGSPTLPDFPKTLGRKRNKAKNQSNSLSCTKHTTAGASEYQDGIELSAAYGWSLLCEKVKNFTPNGAEPRAAMGLSCEIGELAQADAQFTFPEDDPQIIGNWENWNQREVLKAYAERYKKAAYIKVVKVGDYFDSIRNALYVGKAKNQVVMAFGTWYGEWSQTYVPTVYVNFSSYHAYLFVDFDTIDGTEYLVVQNSYGENLGDRGYQYFPRETINKEFAKYGTGLYVFEDLTPEQIALARQSTVFGALQRAIIAVWWAIATKFGLI